MNEEQMLTLDAKNRNKKKGRYMLQDVNKLLQGVQSVERFKPPRKVVLRNFQTTDASDGLDDKIVTEPSPKNLMVQSSTYGLSASGGS